ncbi:TraR/DksA C4-type zinc finger protein [Numidum massiliense]|uniref:TraR/DksA C4-type zinc finger protein n=1 Tax=Numidum massiliense TaxID=1522315 RepID=UPI0006D56213|nr:TraR/DksA C4-type zinc finger protein [Numidum massiliense]
MNSEQLAQLRQQLTEERAAIETRLDQTVHYGLKTGMNDSVGELAGYDNHPADLGSEMFERGKDIALNELDEHRLEDVTAALKRMEDGTYGVCVTCGREISPARLQANPTAKFCVDHQLDDEQSFRRPIEEEVLTPTFGKYNYDGDDRETEFDAEDAWQAVEQYGTSNPPDFYREGRSYNELGNEPDERRGAVEDIENIAVADFIGEHNEDGSIELTRNDAYRRLQAEEEAERDEGEGERY